MSQEFYQSCDYCGRVYTEAGPFTRHVKVCTKGRKRLASALIRAREMYLSKKRPCVQEPEAEESIQEDASWVGGECAEQVRDHEVNIFQ